MDAFRKESYFIERRYHLSFKTNTTYMLCEYPYFYGKKSDCRWVGVVLAIKI